MMKLGAVILAAGSGQRFGSDKLAILLKGKPVWWHSFVAFRDHPLISEVLVVCSDSNYHSVKQLVGNEAEVLLGGDTRTASTVAGLWKASQIGCEGLMFHDGARPFVSAEIIDRVAEKIFEGKAVAAAVPVVDTIKSIDGPEVDEHLDRSHLIATQTPQGAPTEMFALAITQGLDGVTDDIQLLSKAGYRTYHVMGDPANFKITTPEDLARARALLGSESRTGLGYDIHRFSDDPSRPCWLGGVLFPGEVGLEGHSDADVVIHAVVDALLGAISAGDIGQLFPNDDPANKDRASADFLVEAVQRVHGAGWMVNHIDIAIQAEKPKIMPRATDIRERLAQLVGVELDRVSIKATTNEGLGAIGRAEGICAFATASVSR
jgi:2-C-methyl-D-erythritol 4-phosphate cytidylyltransferase/2-C-methyl-D-erythritol 2,4-cyclodiphosphate synthase